MWNIKKTVEISIKTGATLMDKKMVIIIFLLSCISINNAQAHPGNTDSSGGHTCRTNCEEWGLDYGEYHYHDSHSTIDFYQEGYDEGYAFSYSYTSQCEEDYEWWWEGPDSYGEGYEAGIEDGHYDGLEVCFENSYQIGFDTGYDDYQSGNEYDENTYEKHVDESSYGKGYAEGWADAKSEEPVATSVSTSTDSDTELIVEEDKVEKGEDGELGEENPILYQEAYEEGLEAAQKGYVYDASDYDLSENEQRIYREGYRSGWFAGGGGNVFEQTWYYLSEKYINITFPVLGGIVFLTAWLFKRRADKRDLIEGWGLIIPWILSGIGVLIFAMWLLPSIVSDSEPASTETEEDNPYTATDVDHDCGDFDTQEDAQLFYEANGGPNEDPHDLDRDDDGMACDWNP